MKNSILLFSALILSSLLYAQAPQKMSYQTVIRNATDDLVSNTTVGIQISILQGSAVGTAVYVEVHAPTTNANGLASLEIGGGTPLTGTMAAIDWVVGPYFVKSEVDPDGGTSYTLSIVSELLSVPYALHASTSGDKQWSESGSGINTSHFSVGINSAFPQHTLDVRSASQAEPAGLNVSNDDRSRYVRFFSGSETYPDPSMSWAPSYDLLFATFDDNTLNFSEKMRISSAGDVGIGIIDPEARLDILGGDWNLDDGNPGDLRIGNATNNFRIGVATGGGGAGIARLYTNSNAMILGSNDTPSLILEADGRIRAPSLSDSLIDIAGNESLITKQYADATYRSSTESKEIIISPLSFTTGVSTAFFSSSNGTAKAATGEYYDIYAPIELPIGATITEVVTYFRDNTDDRYFISLKSINIETGTQNTFFSLLTADNSDFFKTLTSTTPIQIMSDMVYFIEVIPANGSLWGSLSGVRGVKVTYTD